MNKLINNNDFYDIHNGTILKILHTGTDWHDEYSPTKFYRVVKFGKALIKIGDNNEVKWQSWYDWNEHEFKDEQLDLSFEVYDCGDGVYETPQRECQCSHKASTAAITEKDIKLIAFDYINNKVSIGEASEKTLYTICQYTDYLLEHLGI